MSPRSLPASSWFLGLLFGLIAALTGCESDGHHRRDDRDGPRGPQQFERRMPDGRPQGPQQQGDWQPGPPGPQSGPQSGPQAWGDDRRNRGDQGREPESILHRLEMGREAAREIGDTQAAELMQRAVERTRQGDRRQDRRDQHDGDREHMERLERLEQRVEMLMRAVEEMMRERSGRKAI